MKKINTAICSFGMSGQIFHAPFIDAHPGFNLYGVWERSVKKATGKYPGIISFDSLDQMLADSNVELVIVNTPVNTHFEYAKKALEAGKHILVEKAFTVTAAEAAALVKLAAEKKLKLCVFQNRRWDSDLKTVKKIKEEGLLGDIKEAEFHYDRYNLALSPKQHKEDGNPGAGILHDLGPHLIDQALYLFGTPESVFGSVKFTRPETIVNDYIDILLFYPALTVRLKAGFIVKEIPYSFILHGTNGSFLKPRADVQEDQLKAGVKPTDEGYGIEPATAEGLINYLKDGETIRKNIPTEHGDYMQLFNGLYDSIVNDTTPPVSGNDGLNTMRVIEAVAESEKEGKVVKVG